MPTYTPGPWKIGLLPVACMNEQSNQTRDCVLADISTGYIQVIARPPIVNTLKGTEIIIANLVLCAAAPTLLDILRRMVAETYAVKGFDGNLVTEAENAIFSAEGRQ